LLEKLAAEAKNSGERQQWIRQLADTASVAVQSGTFPEGVERLKAVEARLAKDKADHDLLAYVAFRRLSADYTKSLQVPNADFVKIQSEWVKQLEEFVQQHSKSPDSAEALLQLAIAEEFSGRDEDAIRWYDQLLKDFSKSSPAQKATGAKRRLQSVGKRMTLRGRDLRGRTVDLAKYRGKTVLIQYWATWCEPCITDMARIKELLAKYTKQGFAVVGVSLDSQRSDVVNFLKTNRIPWQQMYEPGGLESRLANEMGILTLPTMILVDDKGRVINRSIHVTELDSELKRLLR
ncbi:MAG: redoxin domain-containing protein, partial [Pirellulales bacterium]